jgi:hypothetical protein
VAIYNGAKLKMSLGQGSAVANPNLDLERILEPSICQYPKIVHCFPSDTIFKISQMITKSCFGLNNAVPSNHTM